MVVYSEPEGLGKRAVDEWFCELPQANKVIGILGSF